MWKVFLKLGLSAFGGPAAHIAMLEDEAVHKHQWLNEKEFLGLHSLTQIIPGPNSSEMVLGVGYYINGIKGLLMAGISFMIPSVLLVLLISMFFKPIIHLEWVQWVLDGMTPVLILMIVQVFLRFLKTGVKTKLDWLSMAVFFSLLLFGISEFVVLILAAVFYLLKDKVKTKSFVVEPISISLVFTLFLKIGATLYGSGYVLLMYLENSFLKYMSHQDIVNAFLIGEITPGPVFTSATAIGVFLKGPLGGLVATVGIFLPSFILMMALMPVQEKLLKINWVQVALKGIQVASIALIGMVLVRLLGGYNFSITSIVLFAVIALLKYRKSWNQYQLLVLGPVLNVILNLLF